VGEADAAGAAERLLKLGIEVRPGQHRDQRADVGALIRFRQTSIGMNDDPREDRLGPTLRTVSEAVLGVAAELSVDEVLQRLVASARELADARYAALGLPDGVGGFVASSPRG
jgi:hypothetical protein